MPLPLVLAPHHSSHAPLPPRPLAQRNRGLPAWTAKITPKSLQVRLRARCGPPRAGGGPVRGRRKRHPVAAGCAGGGASLRPPPTEWGPGRRPHRARRPHGRHLLQPGLVASHRRTGSAANRPRAAGDDAVGPAAGPPAPAPAPAPAPTRRRVSLSRAAMSRDWRAPAASPRTSAARVSASAFASRARRLASEGPPCALAKPDVMALPVSMALTPDPTLELRG